MNFARVGPAMINRRALRGVAIVEMTVALPVLLVLMLVGVELTRAFVQFHVLTHSVRDASRFLSKESKPGSSGNVILTNTVIQQTRNLVVYGNIGGTGSPILQGLATGNIDVAVAGPDEVLVAAQYTYQPWIGTRLPFFGTGPDTPTTFTLTVRAEMPAVRGQAT